jgi:hypothetical protein
MESLVRFALNNGRFLVLVILAVIVGGTNTYFSARRTRRSPSGSPRSWPPFRA